MNKQGIVRDILDNNKVRVLVMTDCYRDEHCHECGLCAKNKSADEDLELIVDMVSGVKKGSRVELAISAPRRSYIAVLIYLFPLVLLFIGGVVGNSIAGTIGMLLGGTGGFILAFLVVYLAGKTMFRLSGKIISVT